MISIELIMEIKPVTNNKEWRAFVCSKEPMTMLQSWNWGDFEEKQGHEVLRLGLYDNDELIGAGLYTIVRSRRAHYIVTHAGPLIDWQDAAQFNMFHEYIRAYCKENNLDFMRFRAPLSYEEEALKPFLAMGYKKAPMYFNAEYTMVLDLTKSEDELLASMRKNTRYYVRRAEKQGVTVRISTDPKDIDILFDVYQKTVERHHFVPYGKQFFVDEFEAFYKDDLIEILIAEKEGVALAAAFLVYYDDSAFYHHSGSVRTDPEVYAQYALQWALITRAKERGKTRYDFWGVAPTDDPNHPRAGLTLFKRGFGGQRVRWMHTLDFPIKKWKYALVWAFVKLERWKKRL